MGYNAECPVCPSDHAFYYTPHNNFGYCFACGYKTTNSDYTQIELERSPRLEEIREYYSKMTMYYHSSLTKKALDYLYSRGYTDHFIKEKMIGYCPTGVSHLYSAEIASLAGLAKKDGSGFLQDRITFPYIVSHAPFFVSDIRGRALSKQEVKYLSPHGYNYTRGSDYLYNHYLMNMPSDATGRLLLCESEIKADIALLYGFNAVGLPGMTVWKRGFIQREDQEIIICFDNQKHNYEKVQDSIKKVASRLSSVKVATLPLYGDKSEVDTFIPKYGKELFAVIINNSLRYEDWLRLQ